jgi:hypothetical protein
MTQQPTYGPHNPHPLSQMRTELVWEGKYDEYGQRREVDIAGCAMPMQKIEGIDEPRRERRQINSWGYLSSKTHGWMILGIGWCGATTSW